MDRGNCVAAWNEVGCGGVRLGPVAWGAVYASASVVSMPRATPESGYSVSVSVYVPCRNQDNCV